MMRLILVILALLLLVAVASADITEVGGGSQRETSTCDNTTACVTAYPSNVAAGSLVTVAGCVWNNPTISSVADTRGTSYSVITATDGAFRAYIATGITPGAGANTVTVTYSAAGSYGSQSITEFAGAASPPLDVDGGNSAGSGTAASDTITTTTANDLLLGVLCHATGLISTLTPGGSYTEIGEQENNFDNTAHSAVFRIVTTATTYTVDWTIGDSVNWHVTTAAYKPAVAVAGAGGLLLRGVGP